MNPQLSALLNNKPALFGVAAAGAVGLGLWTKKKKGATPATATAGATIPGTLPAAAVVQPSATGSYDSSAFDAYNALQPELEQILQQQNHATTGAGITTAPTPIASTLLQPTYSGNNVRFTNGQIDEVESDGSLLWLNPQENAKAMSAAGGSTDWVRQLQVNAPDATGSGTVYDTGKNLLAKQSQFVSGS